MDDVRAAEFEGADIDRIGAPRESAARRVEPPRVRFEIVASIVTPTWKKVGMFTLKSFAAVLFGTSAGLQLFGSS